MFFTGIIPTVDMFNLPIFLSDIYGGLWIFGPWCREAAID
jgi:hypothetical protein